MIGRRRRLKSRMGEWEKEKMEEEEKKMEEEAKDS